MEYNEYLVNSEKTLSEASFQVLPDEELNVMRVELENLTNAGAIFDLVKRSLYYGDGISTVKLYEHMKTLDARSTLVRAVDPLTTDEKNELHACLGIVTEAIELVVPMMTKLIGKTAGFKYTETDEINIQEELGDIEWYEAILMRQHKYTKEQIYDANIKKLAKRYPKLKFDAESAVNRDKVKELDHIQGTPFDDESTTRKADQESDDA